MKRLVALYEAIDRTTSTNAKVDAMRRYFAEAPPADAAWAVFILSGRKLKRVVSYVDMARWALEASGLPKWLFAETHAAVGDLAETIALVLDRGPRAAGCDADAGLAEWMEARLIPLRGKDKGEQRAIVTGWWASCDRSTVYIINKLLTGALRVGVAGTLVVRAVAEHLGIERDVAARRMHGEFTPSAAWFAALGEPEADGVPRPVPFFLASPIDGDAHAVGAALGLRDDWIAEHKWDGIRAQAIRGASDTVLWSRGEEPVTDAFPELAAALSRLAEGVILDGEILAHDDTGPLPFATLQKRLGRKAVSARTIARYPCVFMAYDLLADGEGDRTAEPIESRRAALERAVRDLGPRVRLSPIIAATTWEALEAERARARDLRVEGIMLKRKGSPYRVGRVKGDWWKWKIAPHTLDLVLTYAQPGHGRRASLLTDYTFGVWADGPGSELITLTKAYSGLDQDEIARLDAWIRAHTVERFGPVRRVEPVHVFEIAFERAARSDRHRAGIALRFPRILRWRTDKTASDADTLATVRALVAGVAETERRPPETGVLPGFGG